MKRDMIISVVNRIPFAGLIFLEISKKNSLFDNVDFSFGAKFKVEITAKQNKKKKKKKKKQHTNKKKKPAILPKCRPYKSTPS